MGRVAWYLEAVGWPGAGTCAVAAARDVATLLFSGDDSDELAVPSESVPANVEPRA